MRGTYDSTRLAVIRIKRINEDEFEMSYFYGLTSTRPVVRCKAMDNNIKLRHYECNNCPGPPSPGGKPRNYTINLDGQGECINGGDSLVLYLDIDVTGSFETNKFRGNVYLKKEE